VDPTPGDLDGNAELILRAAREAQAQHPDLIVTSELALMGYLPRDLLMSQGFVRRAGEKMASMAAELRGSAPLLVGVATLNPAPIGRPLFNSAVLLRDGAVGPAFHKMLLPTYDVWASASARTSGTTAISGSVRAIIWTPFRCWRKPARKPS
jgi:NAD+ synthase/NAD+ synthase (glutamine-hydrolysing)